MPILIILSINKKIQEPDLIIQTNFSKMFSGILGGLDMSLDYSRLSLKNDTVGSPYNNTIFRLIPGSAKAVKTGSLSLDLKLLPILPILQIFIFIPVPISTLL